MKTYTLSYRGWIAVVVATPRTQGNNVWQDLVITNDQNADEFSFSVLGWEETPGEPSPEGDLDEFLFNEYYSQINDYIDNNGGTIG